MSVVRRNREGRIVLVPDVKRVAGMRRKVLPGKQEKVKAAVHRADPDEAVKTSAPKPVPAALKPKPAPVPTSLPEGGDPVDVSEPDVIDEPASFVDVEAAGDDVVEDVETPTISLPEPPKGNASRQAWADYAAAIGYPVGDGMTRNDIRDSVAGISGVETDASTD